MKSWGGITATSGNVLSPSVERKITVRLFTVESTITDPLRIERDNPPTKDTLLDPFPTSSGWLREEDKFSTERQVRDEDHRVS